jgi:hypothetical protein
MRGEKVIPMIELSSKPMRTRFGMKSRPDFKILDWVNFGGPSASAIAALITKLTPAEIINDDIPF